MRLFECELSQLLIDEHSTTQTVLLRVKDDPRVIPIAIGMVEALAINSGLQDSGNPRPLTHDLLLSVMRTLGGVLDKVVINDLVNMQTSWTFLAVLEIILPDQSRQLIDCRPSDALALIVRTRCPLYVSEKVVDAAGTEEYA